MIFDIDIGIIVGHSVCQLSVVYSPNRKVASHGLTRQCDCRIWSRSALQSYMESVLSVVFTSNRKKLAFASADETILWDVDSGIAFGSTLEAVLVSAVFAPDGKKLPSAPNDGTVWLWDVESGTTVDPLEGHTKSVMSVVFSPGGKKLASASYDWTM